ncbi:hypothetical protein ACKLNQ_10615, partial [Myroides odoratimimus]
MNKKVLSVAFLMGSAITVNAQVGIGTADPSKSAELSVVSKNRGVIIPNVELTNTKDSKTITNGNIESLLVFATKKQGDITPGYYYWAKDKWNRLTTENDISDVVVNNFEEILNLNNEKVKNVIKNLVGTVTGQDGRSAYDVAVEYGFKGNEKEWLLSLIGKDGKNFTYSDFTQEQLSGLKGDKGADGVDGKSAFDIWKEVTNNPTATEQEYLSGLKGDKGADGVDGKSAFDIWKEVTNNPTATEQEYLSGLKGDKGADGVDGKSAFDIWKEVTNNPTATEQEYL